MRRSNSLKAITSKDNRLWAHVFLYTAIVQLAPSHVLSTAWLNMHSTPLAKCGPRISGQAISALRLLFINFQALQDKHLDQRQNVLNFGQQSSHMAPLLRHYGVDAIESSCQGRITSCISQWPNQRQDTTASGPSLRTVRALIAQDVDSGV